MPHNQLQAIPSKIVPGFVPARPPLLLDSIGLGTFLGILRRLGNQGFQPESWHASPYTAQSKPATGSGIRLINLRGCRPSTRLIDGGEHIHKKPFLELAQIEAAQLRKIAS